MLLSTNSDINNSSHDSFTNVSIGKWKDKGKVKNRDEEKAIALNVLLKSVQTISLQS